MSINDFMNQFQHQGLTFDDVLLVINRSEVLPNETNLETRLTRNIRLKIPFVSAAMDTVTQWKMAVAMARAGGIGILHKNMTIKRQVEEVKRVKKYLNGFIESPVFFYHDQTVEHILKEKEDKEYNFQAFQSYVETLENFVGSLPHMI